MAKPQRVVKMDEHFEANITSFLREHEIADIIVPDLPDFPEINVEVNRITGDITLESEVKNSNIKNLYSNEAFPKITQPISDEMHLQAKTDLLMKLDQLGDKRISDVIRKHHLTQTGEFQNASLVGVNKTLVEIERLSRTPLSGLGIFGRSGRTQTQQVVASVLKQYRYENNTFDSSITGMDPTRIYKIKSSDDVNAIMDTIHTKLGVVKPEVPKPQQMSRG